MGGGGAGHYQSAELRVGRDQEGTGLGEGVAMVAVELGAGLQHHPGHALYYLCVREAGSSSYTHQGHHKQVTVETRCFILHMRQLSAAAILSDGQNEQNRQCYHVDFQEPKDPFILNS